jgi:hypothetical protein
MPQIEIWSRLPAAIRDHLIDRVHDRNIRLEDLNALRVWLESKPNLMRRAAVQRLWFVQALRRR